MIGFLNIFHVFFVRIVRAVRIAADPIREQPCHSDRPYQKLLILQFDPLSRLQIAQDHDLSVEIDRRIFQLHRQMILNITADLSARYRETGIRFALHLCLPFRESNAFDLLLKITVSSASFRIPIAA